MAYNGSIDLISGIRPKNNGTFPLVDAKDVYVTDDKRLDAALNEKAEAVDVIPKPAAEGTTGQILRIDEEGDPAWSDVGTPTEEQVGDAVGAWLTAHPEATTTVQDGTINYNKLDVNLKGHADAIAPTEATATASMPYAVGDHFFLGGVLYEATAAIASGGSIVTTGQGVNVKAVPNLSEQVGELKSAIQYATLRFFCEYGNVKNDGTEQVSTSYIRTPVIDSRKVKTFKYTRASGVIMSSYKGYREGSGWSAIYSYITEGLNGSFTINDDTIVAIRLVFTTSGGGEMTTAQRDGTWVDTETELFQTVENNKNYIKNLNYATLRYFTEIGNVNSSGGDTNSDYFLRTREIDCSKCKQFKVTNASGVVTSSYKGYVEGSGWSVVTSSIVDNGNGYFTVNSDTITKLRVVFADSQSGTITTAQMNGTWVDTATDLFKNVENNKSDIKFINEREDWSISRYPFEIGSVNASGEDSQNSKRCRTKVINTTKIKTFKAIIPTGFAYEWSVGCVSGSWGNYTLTISGTGTFTVGDTVDYIRVVFQKGDGTQDISDSEIAGLYILPYVDANVRVDTLEQEIEDAREQMNIELKGDGFSSRFLHTAARGGVGMKPLWTIVDDDGRVEVPSVWLPIMQSKHIPITIPLFVAKIGNDEAFMTWEQVKTMAEAGAEICSHTQNHADLSTLTESELRSEFSTSLGNLLLHGYNNKYLVCPYNRYNDLSMRIASEYFDCSIALKSNVENNTTPIDTYALTRVEIGNEQTLAEHKAYIDHIVANNGWLITMSHSQSAYMKHPERIEEMIDYAQQSGVEIVTIREALKYFANVIEIGTSWDSFYSGIDPVGKTFGTLRAFGIESLPSNFTGENIFDCFPKMSKTICNVSASKGATFGYPDGSSGGVLEVYRASGNYYNYMEWKPLGQFKTYRKEYNDSWSEWTQI